MHEFLIILMYHYSEDYSLWNKGYISDYEASTGLYIAAPDSKSALQWSRVVSCKLLNFVNQTNNLTLEEFQHENWLEVDPKNSPYSHCLDYFQHVSIGEIPQLDQMTTKAYTKWLHSKA